jgi:hypothetical protein
MRRLLLVFAVMAVMAAMVAVMAAPAFADKNSGCRGVIGSQQTQSGGSLNSANANERAPFPIFDCA